MIEHLGTRTLRAGRIATLALAGLLWGALLVGCGGGDDGGDDSAAAVTTSSPESPSLNRDEIIAEGDAICAEVNAAVGGLEATDASPSIQLSQRADLYTGMVERLRGLDSDDPELTAVFSAGRDLVQAASEAGAAAARGDTEATVSAETTVTAALAAFRAAANTYGFTECGGPPSRPIGPGSATDPGGTEPTVPDATQPAPEPEPQAPAPPAGGAAADGGSPATGTDDGSNTDGGTGADAGSEGGGNDGGGGSSSTGGFSPGG